MADGLLNCVNLMLCKDALARASLQCGSDPYFLAAGAAAAAGLRAAGATAGLTAPSELM